MKKHSRPSGEGFGKEFKGKVKELSDERADLRCGDQNAAGGVGRRTLAIHVIV